MPNLLPFKLAGFLVFMIASANGQKSKVESSDRRKLVSLLTVEQLRNQQHSALAQEVTIEYFMSYYIEYEGKDSKKYRLENLDSLYSDSVFTYYVHRAGDHKENFFKVRLAEISDIRFSEIDGNFIRKKFIDEIVPLEDKKRVERKCKGCVTGSEFQSFEYYYDKESGLVEIRYNWKVACDFRRAIKKTYRSYYNWRSKTFQN